MTQATIDVEFECPGCGRAVTVATGDDGEQAVLHVLPMCVTFAHMRADEYLSWVRAKLEESDAD